MNRISGKKLIVKHFMRRTVPKRCVLGVFWTIQYVSEVNFTWRRLLFTLVTSFYGYLYFTRSKTKKSVQLLHFGDIFLNGISLDFCRNPRNVHFDLNSVFSLSYRISFADLCSLFMDRITYSKLTIIQRIEIAWCSLKNQLSRFI